MCGAKIKGCDVGLPHKCAGREKHERAAGSAAICHVQRRRRPTLFQIDGFAAALDVASRLSAAATASIMIVASGAIHAVVNAILKSGQDKMSSRALIDGVSGLLILPAVFFVPLPTGPGAGWPAAG